MVDLSFLAGYNGIDLSDITDAANIRYGTNPAYAIADFLAVYPQFGSYGEEGEGFSGQVPETVVQMYVNLASAALSYERWQETWEVAMSLFVAHYLTLYMSSMTPAGATTNQVAAKGLAAGVMVSKSVADVSASYQVVTDGIDGWAAYKLTRYGQQLLTIGRLVGMGGMVVW